MYYMVKSIDSADYAMTSNRWVLGCFFFLILKALKMHLL